MKIYCDTNTLHGNVTSEAELKALQTLKSDSELEWFTSHVVQHEVMPTSDEGKRAALVDEHKGRKLVPKYEKIVGYNAQTDLYGGFVGFALISDVQDEDMRTELLGRGLTQRDAEHITQAVCNNCDVFLTRDVRTIIEPHRVWLEARFPPLRVRQPSELAKERAAMARGEEDIADDA